MPISLLPNMDENNLMLRMYDEAIQLYGIDCKLIDYDKINLYLDDRDLSDNHLPYKILLQDYVDKRILNNLTWLNNEKQDSGQVAFSPILYLGERYKLCTGQVIELYNGDLWQIGEINRSYLVGICYVLKLVPYIDERNRDRDGEQMRSNYLKSLVKEFK